MWVKRARLKFKIPMAYISKTLGLSEKRIRCYELNGNFPDDTFEKYKEIVAVYTNEKITKTNCEAEDVEVQTKNVIDECCGTEYDAENVDVAPAEQEEITKDIILAEFKTYADALNSRGLTCLKSFARILATHPVYRIRKY